jgi:hypothetical protein
VTGFPDEVTAPDDIRRFQERDETPTIASISDIHGYLDAARSALTAVGEASRPPLVTSDSDDRLHWANNDYVLIVNGDLIDRGSQNDACLDLVQRLMREAPPGRVRYHLGNHEMAVLFPKLFSWPGVYSVELDRKPRQAFIQAVASGTIPTAFKGYRYTYSHAGANESIDVPRVNEMARSAANELLAALDTDYSRENQERIVRHHDTVFGLGGVYGRGSNAGLLWMDFKHMTVDAPPQVVGHTRQQSPTRTGRVVCQNVIRKNLSSAGGEAILLEDQDGLEAVVRTADGVTTIQP